MKTYLKFVENKNTLRFSCDKNCETLMEHIAIADLRREPLTVTQAMQLGFVSTASMHRKINDLRNAGYVTTVYRDLNRRTKYLTLAPIGVQYFKSIDLFLREAQ